MLGESEGFMVPKIERKKRYTRWDFPWSPGTRNRYLSMSRTMDAAEFLRGKQVEG